MDKIIYIFEFLFISFEVIVIIMTYLYSVYRYKHVMEIYKKKNSDEIHVIVNKFKPKSPIIVSNMTEQINTKEIERQLSYPVLIFNLNGIEIKSVTLNQDTTFIGRGKNDDIVIDESTISRSQCFITNEESKYYLNIDRRTNPIYLNGEEVIQEQTELFDGDIVSLGDGRITFLFVMSNNISNPKRA